MKKRLLKDLPFQNLRAGTVLTSGNGGYFVEMGDTIYEGGSSSHRGWKVLSDVESAIVDLIWGNDEWCEEATVNHIEICATCDSIILKFKPLDLGEAQNLARGIQDCIMLRWKHDDGQNYTWDKYAGFTTSLK